MTIDETTSVNLDLFSDQQGHDVYLETICHGASVIRHFACDNAEQLIASIADIALQAPFRNMKTANGASMSVAMTNCGQYGWLSDQTGYQYSTRDPSTGKGWPSMPVLFTQLAITAAKKAGFDNFHPNACLINRYQVGSRMGLHQDKDEHDLSAPIVSVSLGIPATFLFGGSKRKDHTTKVQLDNGDVVVFGGAARLNYHGISTVKNNFHELTEQLRYNLTFRQAT
jgi:DNA oxidative demethylase